MTKLIGVLKIKGEENLKTERFKVREFVVTDDSGPYPQHLKLQLTQERCGLLDPFNIGDTLTIDLELRGREHQSKNGEVNYYNSLEVQKIKRTGKADEE